MDIDISDILLYYARYSSWTASSLTFEIGVGTTTTINYVELRYLVWISSSFYTTMTSYPYDVSLIPLWGYQYYLHSDFQNAAYLGSTRTTSITLYPNIYSYNKKNKMRPYLFMMGIYATSDANLF